MRDPADVSADDEDERHEIAEFERIRKGLGWSQRGAAIVMETQPKTLRESLVHPGSKTYRPLSKRMYALMLALDHLHRAGRLGDYLAERGIDPADLGDKRAGNGRKKGE